jgi:hypothetical protein
VQSDQPSQHFRRDHGRNPSCYAKTSDSGCCATLTECAEANANTTCEAHPLHRYFLSEIPIFEIGRLKVSYPVLCKQNCFRWQKIEGTQLVSIFKYESFVAKA